MWQPETDPAYEEYLDRQDRHTPCYDVDDGACRVEGQEADCPAIMFLECFDCGPRLAQPIVLDTGALRYHPVVQLCVGRGAVVNRQDPTQTYRLACGHVTI